MLMRTWSFISGATERSRSCFKQEIVKHNLVCVFKVDAGYCLEGEVMRAQEWGWGGGEGVQVHLEMSHMRGMESGREPGV